MLVNPLQNPSAIWEGPREHNDFPRPNLSAQILDNHSDSDHTWNSVYDLSQVPLIRIHDELNKSSEQGFRISYSMFHLLKVYSVYIMTSDCILYSVNSVYSEYSVYSSLV